MFDYIRFFLCPGLVIARPRSHLHGNGARLVRPVDVGVARVQVFDNRDVTALTCMCVCVCLCRFVFGCIQATCSGVLSAGLCGPSASAGARQLTSTPRATRACTSSRRPSIHAEQQETVNQRSAVMRLNAWARVRVVCTHKERMFAFSFVLADLTQQTTQHNTRPSKQ